MAAARGPTPHGIRIGFVYTPVEWRGRGYASACVAALSQQQLDQGKSLCFLYSESDQSGIGQDVEAACKRGARSH